jgi:hypothetical protein
MIKETQRMEHFASGSESEQSAQEPMQHLDRSSLRFIFHEEHSLSLTLI